MEENVPSWLIPSRVYDVLKWVGLIIFPALAVAFGTVAQAWGMDAETSQAVVLTLNALGTFVGAVIGASAVKNYVATKGGDSDAADAR